MERNAQKYTLINLLTLVAAAISGYAVARYSHAVSGAVSVVFMVLGVLVSAVSWFQTRLEERERLEKLEFDELTRTAASSALFTTGETEVFPAQRSREQFERFFVPGFTVLLLLLQLGQQHPLEVIVHCVGDGGVIEPGRDGEEDGHQFILRVWFE